MHIFKTWVYAGVRYIAVKAVDGEQVLDEAGRYFGAWRDHESFRQSQKEGRTNSHVIATGASLAVRR